MLLIGVRPWLMIKANMKQMGLHGERRNVTGMVQRDRY